MYDRAPSSARRLVVPCGPLFLLFVCVCPQLGCAGASPPVRILSTFESTTGARISRDCGYSSTIGARGGSAFWLFCDTAVYDRAGALSAFIAGSTAAFGPLAPHEVPSGLVELATPPTNVQPAENARSPAPFLAEPTGLSRNDGVPCLAPSYPAAWATGVARVPTGSALVITYTNVCVVSAWEIVLASQGVVEYAPLLNVLGTPATLFSASGGASLRPQERLGSPVFDDDGLLYTFASACDDEALGTCTTGRVFLARVPADRRAEGDAYEWLTLDGWNDEASLAISIVPGAAPHALHVDDYRAVGRDLVMIETTDIAGAYRLWSAPRPRGPWAMRGSGRLEGCADAGDRCRALIGHPEASTESRLALSYFRANDAHVAMTFVRW